MNIPPDAKIVRDSRLTLIRIVATLYERIIDGADSLKAKVKATMKEKDAAFAESDLAVAALRAGAAKASIDPKKLHKLIDAKKLTLDQFLECVTVRKEPLKAYLSGDAIDKLTTAGKDPEPALYVDLKDGQTLDLDRLTRALIDALEPAEKTAQ